MAKVSGLMTEELLSRPNKKFEPETKGNLFIDESLFALPVT